jgi:hypothetical protein
LKGKIKELEREIEECKSGRTFAEYSKDENWKLLKKELVLDKEKEARLALSTGNFLFTEFTCS